MRGFRRSGDVINAQGGNDILRGGAGDDTLIEENGEDLLQGGFGHDTLVEIDRLVMVAVTPSLFQLARAKMSS